MRRVEALEFGDLSRYLTVGYGNGIDHARVEVIRADPRGDLVVRLLHAMPPAWREGEVLAIAAKELRQASEGNDPVLANAVSCWSALWEPTATIHTEWGRKAADLHADIANDDERGPDIEYSVSSWLAGDEQADEKRAREHREYMGELDRITRASCHVQVLKPVDPNTLTYLEDGEAIELEWHAMTDSYRVDLTPADRSLTSMRVVVTPPIDEPSDAVKKALAETVERLARQIEHQAIAPWWQPGPHTQTTSRRPPSLDHMGPRAGQPRIRTDYGMAHRVMDLFRINTT